MRSKLRTGMTLAVTVLLFLAFNLVWIGKLPDIRWDVSERKIHTLSAPTRLLMASLESPLDLYYFNTHNAPGRRYALNRYGKRIEDTLKEFEKASRGMINLHLIDPTPFSEDAYKAELFGLEKNAGFLGLIATRAGQAAQRIESFSLDREALLEYEISHLIYKLQHPAPPTVGLLSGLAMENSAGRLLAQMQRYFNLISLEPTTERVPEQIKTLMVVHPRALSETTLFAIEQFVLKGGKLMLFEDPVREQDPKMGSLHTKLDELLAAWGVRMPADNVLVDTLYASLDEQSAAHNPARLTLPRLAMNPHDVSSWRLNSVTISRSGALTRLKKSRTTFTRLLQSSGRSALVDSNRLDAGKSFESPPDPGQRHVIAARVEGPSYSVFPTGIKGQPIGLQKASQVHVVVVADTDLLTDKFNSAAHDSNTLFVLNTLDNLAAGDALAGVRPRAPAPRAQTVLNDRREKAEQAYREKADELQHRLQRTEQEWQSQNPRTLTLGTQAVASNIQLQALNKERLRIPMELNALRHQAYVQVLRIELGLKLAPAFGMPLTLCLVAWLVFLGNQRRRAAFDATIY